jgi:hypothetical protein
MADYSYTVAHWVGYLTDRPERLWQEMKRNVA